MAGSRGTLQSPNAPAPVRAASPAAPVAKAPAFKKSGMQLGGKKTTQSQLLDALGGEALLSEDMSAPATPVPAEHQTFQAVQHAQSTLPTVTPERSVESLYACHKQVLIMCG